MIMIVFCYGYTAFAPWSVETFFIYYTMLIVAPILFIFWKLLHRTKFVKPTEADLVWEKPTIDAYEATFVDPPVGFWTELIPRRLRFWGGKQNREVERRRPAERVPAANEF
jgi:amino acid transporter